MGNASEEFVRSTDTSSSESAAPGAVAPAAPALENYVNTFDLSFRHTLDNFDTCSYYIPQLHFKRKSKETVSAQEASLLIPTFDGENPPVIFFINACRKACSFITSNLEVSLFCHAITKLRGEAAAYIEGMNIYNMNNLILSIKQIFFYKTTFNTLLRQMDELHIKPGESIIQYANRFKRLHLSIVEYKMAQSKPEEHLSELVETLESDHKQKFVNGLSSKYRDTVRFNMNNCMANLIGKTILICYEIDRLERLDRKDKFPAEMVKTPAVANTSRRSIRGIPNLIKFNKFKNLMSSKNSSKRTLHKKSKHLESPPSNHDVTY